MVAVDGEVDEGSEVDDSAQDSDIDRGSEDHDGMLLDGPA